MLHSKQWYYSLHRDFQNCYSTRRSLTRFFSSNPSSNSSSNSSSNATRAHYTTIQRILHPESNSIYRRQRALRVLQSRNSTHRRQGDLLEMHPCVYMTFQLLQLLQRHSRHSSHSWPSSLSRQFYKFYNDPVSPGNPPHSSILQLECIFYIFYSFYSSIGFHRKLQRVPVEQLQTLQTFILQRKGDVAISVKMSRCQDDIFPRIELIPSFVLSSDNTNCKNDIQLFHQLFDELSVHTDYH